LDAVHTVLKNPNPKRQSVCLRQLITHLLDTRQTKMLVALPYDNLVDIVIDILEARCKMEVVTVSSQMYNIAYAFYVSRSEYGRGFAPDFDSLFHSYFKAAKLMYELSLRLRHEIHNRTILQRRCNALATVYETMQISELGEENVIECEIEYASVLINHLLYQYYI
jgi:hypothetical protein